MDSGVKPSNIVEEAAAPEREAASEVTQVDNHMEASTDEPTHKIETGRTKAGMEYVRVYGSKQAAEAVCREYQSKGQKTSPVNKDKYRQSVWYFYLS